MNRAEALLGVEPPPPRKPARSHAAADVSPWARKAILAHPARDSRRVANDVGVNVLQVEAVRAAAATGS